MEKDSPSKPSVAELAERFKGHILPMPTSNNEFRKRPPCSLKLPQQKDDNEESDNTVFSPNRFKIKMKNSPIIEKLQANLALSPTALLPSPKSPEVKLQPAPLSPTTPCSPLSPRSPTLRPLHQSSEEEDPVGFDNPPEGTPLPSINKTRARLSFKRRPPTRQHRRSAGEEAGTSRGGPSTCELHSPNENGDGDQVSDGPEDDAECGRAGSLKEDEDEDRDREKTEDEAARSDRDNEGDPEEEQEAGEAQSSEEQEVERRQQQQQQQPSEPCPARQSSEDEVKTEQGQEETPQEARQDGNDGV